MAVRFQLRRDTAVNWTSANSVLALGEPGVETDTLKVKVGDGSTAWNSLAYSITKDFTDLTSTPTTLAGYGITDALALAGLSVTQNAASGTGAITYNNATGVFSYTPPNFEGLNGNFTGSVFADDSTIMVDGVAATLNLANNTTADLPENTNLYYTDVRADARITNALIDEDNMASDSATKLPSQQSVKAYVDAQTTSETAEGTNLYYTDVRADARITAASIIDLSDADQAVATTDSPTFVNTTLTGYLRGPASFVIDPAAFGDDTGTVVIAGNLQVDGVQTTINSTTVSIDDLNFSIATDAADSAAANGAGITVGGAGATLNYTHATTSWDMNKPLNVTGNIGVTGTVDGVDIQTLNTTAGAALPKAGGTMTGDLLIQKAEPIINLRRSDNALLPGLLWQGSAGAQAASIRMDGDSGSANSLVMSTYNGSSVVERLRILTDAADGIQVTGNVGIGTASPTAQLDIQSNMNASGVFTGSISTTTLTVTAVASGTIAVGDRITDASIEPNTVITALGTGSGGTGTYTVSISQTASSQTLRTTSHTKNLLLFKDTDTSMSGGTQIGTIEFEGSDSSNEGTKAFITAVTQSSASAAMLAFGTAPSGVVNAQTRMVITNSGNVGIGTNSPATGLQVSKGLTNAGGPAAGASTASACFGNDGSDNNYGLVLGADGNGLGYISAQRTDGTATAYPLVIQHTGGNVGIGTTSPDYTLDVSHGTTAEYVATFQNTADNLELKIGTMTGGLLNIQGARVDNNNAYNIALQAEGGNVGIGQNSPGTTLHIGDGASHFVRIENAGSGDVSSGYEIYRGTSTVGAKLYDNPADNASTLLAAGKFNIITGGSGIDFHINASGLVGIQNSDPTSKLEVGATGTKNAIALNGGPNGNATVIEMIDAKSGAYSNVTIDVQLAGAGGYFYQVQVAGTSGSRYQTGGGYTNGTGNFSQSTATGAGWTVSSPSSNLIRFVSNLAGTHPVAWIKIGQGLNANHDEDNVTFTWA